MWIGYLKCLCCSHLINIVSSKDWYSFISHVIVREGVADGRGTRDDGADLSKLTGASKVIWVVTTSQQAEKISRGYLGQACLNRWLESDTYFC